MKPAFFSLAEAKRQRVYAASLQEFADHDYESASLDAICRTANISKGGLYEYISAKEELYFYVLETSIRNLYDYLEADIPSIYRPQDILSRFRTVSQSAINYYLAHPNCVELMVKANHLANAEMQAKARAFFDQQFDRLFGDTTDAGLAYPLPRLMGLMKWLLAKTRNEFARAMSAGTDTDHVRQSYTDEWEFMLAILANGIYQREN